MISISSAGTQGREKGRQRQVEHRGREQRHARGVGTEDSPGDMIDVVSDALLRDHYALGDAGTARGIEDVGGMRRPERLRAVEVSRGCNGPAGEICNQARRVEFQHEIGRGVHEPSGECGGRYDPCGPDIGNQPRETRSGRIGVEWDIRCARLERRKEGDDQRG